MSSLTSLISAVSVVAIVFIVIIIIYLYIDNPGDSVRGAGGTLYENWFEIWPGYLERCVFERNVMHVSSAGWVYFLCTLPSHNAVTDTRNPRLYSLGTFVFTFVSQHTVHLTYESIKSDVKSLENWKIVSTVGCHFACHRRVLDGWSNGLLHVLATRWQWFVSNASTALLDWLLQDVVMLDHAVDVSAAVLYVSWVDYCVSLTAPLDDNYMFHYRNPYWMMAMPKKKKERSKEAMKEYRV
jgi:hypothetical protein